MKRNASILLVVCILLCLSFNYTFPLRRDTSNSYYSNHTHQQTCDVHRENIVDRTKKMAINIENALKRFKDSTQDLGKNIYDHVGLKNADRLSQDDLRQYEQLVIRKKYPYLDLKELELRYSPSNKNARQSIKFEPELGNDPGICEPFEEGPNVEITNRGLSGFAIPPQLLIENKLKINNLNNNEDIPENSLKLIKKSPQQIMLKSLKDGVIEYVEKNINRMK